MSLTLAAIYAGATFAAGALGEHAKRKGRYGNADERDRAARESLLTAKYNINQRKIEGRQTQFQVLETGGRKTQEIAIAGLQAEGAAEVAGGSSGATIDSGSPRAVLTSIVQEALQAQTNVVLDTRNHIRAVARDTTNKNTSEWRNAKLNEKQQNRMADRERKSADREYLAGMINTSVKTAGAFASMYSPSPSSVSTAKQVGTGAHVAQSAVRINTPSPESSSRSIPSSNIVHKSKYSYGSFRSNKTFYPKGQSPQSGKIPGGGKFKIKDYSGNLKSSPYNQRGYKPAWYEKGWMQGASFRNFFSGRGIYGTASSKKY